MDEITMNENTDPSTEWPSFLILRRANQNVHITTSHNPAVAATTMASTEEPQNMCKFKTPTRKSSSSTER